MTAPSWWPAARKVLKYPVLAALDFIEAIAIPAARDRVQSWQRRIGPEL